MTMGRVGVPSSQSVQGGYDSIRSDMVDPESDSDSKDSCSMSVWMERDFFG